MKICNPYWVNILKVSNWKNENMKIIEDLKTKKKNLNLKLRL
jgi:hypothetical protein